MVDFGQVLNPWGQWQHPYQQIRKPKYYTNILIKLGYLAYARLHCKNVFSVSGIWN